MRTKISLPLAALAFLLASSATRAHADEGPAIWIETRPWTCSDALPRLARELSLACDAAGAACRVASKESSASERLILHCDASGITSAEGTTVAGAKMWSAELSGDEEEKLRSAAMWALRAAGKGPAPAAEREAPRVAPAVVPAAHAEQPAAPESSTEHRFSLELSARTAYAMTSDNGNGIVGGPRVALGGRILPFLDLGLAASVLYMERTPYETPLVETTTETGFLYRNPSVGHYVLEPTVVAGWGAPFDSSSIGLHAEVGPAVVLGYGANAYFGRAMVTVQGTPKGHAFRPIASVTGSLYSYAMSSVGVDIGFAWGL